ncbi:hypothetical protein [Spirillospora sp. CA-128828]|uniref:hypothetical protein n=1 Tax=Spirillospora sp. CA-128828 TaxID=3240033 RepID=UPI003D948B52
MSEGFPPPAPPHGGVLHHPMLAVDIVGFGRYAPADHRHLRDALYRIVTASFAATAVPLDPRWHEDRGDGILVIAPADISVALLLGYLPHHLHAELRRYNQVSAPAVQLRLRLAVNAGYVQTDAHGAGGRELLHLFRMLDAPGFKTALAATDSSLGLITSDYLYNEIVRSSPGLLDPAAFTQTTIAHKETRAPAWMWLTPTTAHAQPGTPRTPRPGAPHADAQDSPPGPCATAIRPPTRRAAPYRVGGQCSGGVSGDCVDCGSGRM